MLTGNIFFYRINGADIGIADNGSAIVGVIFDRKAAGRPFRRP